MSIIGTRRGAFRDCRPTLKPLVQNFHLVRSSWSTNSAYIALVRPSLYRLKQVATAAVSRSSYYLALLLFIPISRLVLYFCYKELKVQVRPSVCPKVVFFLNPLFFRLHSRCRASRQRQLSLSPRSSGLIWPSGRVSRERNVIRSRLPVTKYSAVRMTNGQIITCTS